MKKRKKENGETGKILLAKDITELVMNRYPSLTLGEVKGAMMSAEHLLMEAMSFYRKEDAR